MKKGIIILFSVLCVLLCIVTVSAKEAKYKNANELFQFWEECGYPNYICGVWSSNESQTHLTFAVQDNENGEEGKQEIIELVEDDSTISFVYQKYSWNYLCKIMDEINLSFVNIEHVNKLGFVSMGIDCYNNCLQINFLEEKKEQKDTTEFIGTITEKYGNAISIGYTDNLPELQENLLCTSPSKQISNSSDNIELYLSLSIVAVGLFLTFGILVKRKNHN